jgi:putative two-component system response regulator
MRSYAAILAAELRAGPWSSWIDDLFLDDLYRASALHDVGKVAIPDSILCKPGPLDAQEREIMQQHTIIGEQILNRIARHQPEISCFRMAAQIARSHHECYDGTGYPDGLRGEQIPLAARIVKVADVFDALTSERVYKAACTPEFAKAEMVSKKGTDFDSVVMDAMVQVFDEFVELHGEPEAAGADVLADFQQYCGSK